MGKTAIIFPQTRNLRENGKMMNDNDKFSHLKRPRHPMPDFVRQALLARGLMDAYRARPPYQQNDYIGWITRAKREVTIQKRLDQMLNELEEGAVYMNMVYHSKHQPKQP